MLGQGKPLMTGMQSTPLPERETAPLPPAIPALPLLSLAAAVLGLILFGWIAERVTHDQTVRFDMAIRGRIHALASPGLTTAMVALSFLGREGIIAGSVVSLIVFWRKRWRRAAIWLAVTMLGGQVLETVLKLAFHRPRPAPFFGPLPYSYSFPSGHALSSFCFYGIMAGLLTARLRSRNWRILLWALAAALVASIGVSRIYLGVHYPGDVLAGYLAAAVWVSAMLVLDRFRTRRRIRSVSSPG
jgi:undecaprenyl-diphosphatase